jgi:hypothetical protein
MFRAFVCLLFLTRAVGWIACRPVLQIFIRTHKRLISYLPVMFCKFYSNELSDFVCNCCLELRHLARVSFCGPCRRGPRRVAHLQVRSTVPHTCAAILLHVHSCLPKHVHKRLFCLYRITMHLCIVTYHLYEYNVKTQDCSLVLCDSLLFLFDFVLFYSHLCD